jgi:TldD protein
MDGTLVGGPLRSKLRRPYSYREGKTLVKNVSPKTKLTWIIFPVPASRSRHVRDLSPIRDPSRRRAALKLLREATDGAEDGELFLERRRSEALVFDDGRVKTASYDAAEGFGLRAVKGDVAGYAHSTEISEAAFRRASETARLAVGDGGGTLADGPAGTNAKLYTDADPIAGATFALKLDTLREIDAFARALDPRVVQVSASLAASHQEVFILRPDGALVSDIRPMVRLNVSIIVEENGRRESGNAGGGGRIGLTGLLERDHWEATAREALRIAVVNLRSEAAPAGVMDVVLGPGWPGISCTRRWATGWRATSTARNSRPSPG